MRGGEWVLYDIARLFPDAPIYTLVHRAGSVAPLLEEHSIRTSWLQAPSFGGRRWRYLLPLMPAAAESFAFPDAELVISTSHAVAKGVIPPPGAFHLSYVHTPMRYVWDQRAQYLDPLPRVLRPIVETRFARLRQWDMVSSARVDRLVANSRLVAWRIQHYWNRTAEVIPPPVATEYFTPGGERADNLLTVAALVPYKRVEVAIAVARKLGRKLEIVGTGPRMRMLRRLGGPDVRFLGWLDRARWRPWRAGRRSWVSPIPVLRISSVPGSKASWPMSRRSKRWSIRQRGFSIGIGTSASCNIVPISSPASNSELDSVSFSIDSDLEIRGSD